MVSSSVSILSPHSDPELCRKVSALKRNADEVLKSRKIDPQKVKACYALVKEINLRIQILMAPLRGEVHGHLEQESVDWTRRSYSGASPESILAENQLDELIKLQREIFAIRERVHDKTARAGIEIL